MPHSQMEKFNLSSIRAKMDWTGVVSRWVGLRQDEDSSAGHRELGAQPGLAPGALDWSAHFPDAPVGGLLSSRSGT